MSKGIASRNSLKALAYPIQVFLRSWGAQQRLSAAEAGAALPALYAVSALQGEALLRQRFFGPLMDRLPVTLDATQQMALWQDFVEEGGLITAWVQRLGVASAMRREAALPADIAQESRLLFGVLLQALSQEQPQLLPWAVEGYFWQCWRGRFPHAPSAGPAPSRDATVLRERLLRGLRKATGGSAAVELRESFKQAPDAVQFSLLTRKDPATPWKPLLTVERPRLKTARLAAYSEAIEALHKGASSG